MELFRLIYYLSLETENIICTDHFVPLLHKYHYYLISDVKNIMMHVFEDRSQALIDA